MHLGNDELDYYQLVRDMQKEQQEYQLDTLTQQNHKDKVSS